MEQTLMIYATTTGGTEANVANVQVPFDCVVEGAQVTHLTTFETDGTSRIQLSEIASQQLNQNGAQNVLLNSSIAVVLTTSGTAQFGSNFYVPLGKRYDAGTYIYLHSVGTAALVATVDIVMYLRRVR